MRFGQSGRLEGEQSRKFVRSDLYGARWLYLNCASRRGSVKEPVLHFRPSDKMLLSRVSLGCPKTCSAPLACCFSLTVLSSRLYFTFSVHNVIDGIRPCPSHFHTLVLLECCVRADCSRGASSQPRSNILTVVLPLSDHWHYELPYFTTVSSRPHS